MESFGNLIKRLRSDINLSLREFCRDSQQDPSNWSKIERGIIPPPKSKEVLNKITEVLKLTPGTEKYNLVFDLAAISFIPSGLINNQEILNSLPIFFRTVRGETPTKEELDKLIQIIKKSKTNEDD